MSTPNLCKDSFIGDYPIVNCQYYGAFEMFDGLKLGEELSLEIEDKIIIKVKKDVTPIGELQLSDTDKNKLLPYLNQGLAGIYTCKLSQNCKDAKLNERLRVSIWVKTKAEIKTIINQDGDN